MTHRYDRHRTKRFQFSSVATKALAAYGAYKIVSWAWGKIQENPTTKKDEEIHGKEDLSSSLPRSITGSPNAKDSQQISRAIARRRQERVGKCRKEAITTISSLLPMLKHTIDSQTDFSKQTQELKDIRSSASNSPSPQQLVGSIPNVRTKRVIWEEIKTKSITRMIVNAYAHSLLVLLLTVQIHLLGGRLFRAQIDRVLADDVVKHEEVLEEKSIQETQRSEVTRSVHQDILLQTYDYFFQEVVRSLVVDVQNVVETVLSKWNVMDENEQNACAITFRDFDDGMRSIRNELDHIQLGNYFSNFCHLGENAANVEACSAFDETLDILESPVFETAKHEVMNMTFDVLQRKGYATLFHDNGVSGDKSQPFVGVITKVRKICHLFYSRPEECTEERWVDNHPCSYPNIFLYNMERINSVRELGDISFS